MKDISVQTHVIRKPILDNWPDNKFMYTIKFNSNSMWYDSTVSIAVYLNTNYNEYVSLMKIRFDCIEYEHKLFYRTKKQCEEAIEFLDVIMVTSKLIK